MTRSEQQASIAGEKNQGVVCSVRRVRGSRFQDGSLILETRTTVSPRISVAYCLWSRETANGTARRGVRVISITPAHLITDVRIVGQWLCFPISQDDCAPTASPFVAAAFLISYAILLAVNKLPPFCRVFAGLISVTVASQRCNCSSERVIFSVRAASEEGRTFLARQKLDRLLRARV